MAETTDYDIPQHIKQYILRNGYSMPFTQMRTYINQWDDMLNSRGDFWDYEVTEQKRTYKVHRRTIHPARRVCEEWASLILNDKTDVVTESEQCNEWLSGFLSRINFFAKGQENITDAFGYGTCAWSIWLDLDEKKMQLRRFDARMIIPLSWDDDGVSECAFCTKTYIGGREYDQLQMHLREDDGYVIRTVIFDSEEGNIVSIEGVDGDIRTNCMTPTFAVYSPAIKNTRVDFSPYGQSVFADCMEVMESVDLCFDAIFKEVDLAKMRVFMSDAFFEIDRDDDGRRQYIPFGKGDATAFRSVLSDDGDFIHEWAPNMRTDQQKSAYRLAVQTMGDKCGFGSQYFDIDKSGGLKTATEVVSDNSALMRNIRKHENILQGAIASLCHSVLACAREFLDEPLEDEGEIKVTFDDSIIIDTASEKAQDLSEVNVTMPAWYYAAKWYGMTEEEAKDFVPSGSFEIPDLSE